MRLLGFVLALLCFASSAAAQTSPILSITHADGEARPAVNMVWYVNAADCAAPNSVTVRLTTTSSLVTALGTTPVVWIGTNCNLTSARDTNNGTCVAADTSIGTIMQSGSSGYEVTLDRLRPPTSIANPSTYDLCNSSGQGAKTLFLLPSNVGSLDTTNFLSFSITSDLTPPTAITITTSAPSGDNAIEFTWTGSVDSQSSVEYFASTGSCGGDAGSTDPNLMPGGAAPIGAAGILTATAGTGGDGSIKSTDLGLDAVGDSAALAIAVRDVAFNYSTLSNVVCASRISTVGLCDALGDCNGGCTVAPMPSTNTRPSIMLVVSLLSLAVAHSWRRR